MLNQQDYYNSVTLQVESLFDLIEIQAERCFEERKLNDIMSDEDFASLERVVMTGCGDSYSAAGAMRETFAMLSGIENTDAPDPMDFTRFWTDEKITGGSAKNTLVISISASGGSDRVVEILARGKSAGARTLLISNGAQSKGAVAAERLFYVETPELCNTPGLRSYFASIIAVVALGAKIGVCKGRLTTEFIEDIKKQMIAYVQSCGDAMVKIAFELGKTWKDFQRFEVVGSGPQYFSAQFVEEKFIECPGAHCSHVDAEDWCHINFHLKDAKTLGTIFHAFQSAPDYNRMRECANSAAAIGRPVMVVTDQRDSDFDQRITICRMPKPAQGCEWMRLLMDFAPGALLAGYVAAEAEKPFFAGRYDFRARKWNVAFN